MSKVSYRSRDPKTKDKIRKINWSTMACRKLKYNKNKDIISIIQDKDLVLDHKFCYEHIKKNFNDETSLIALKIFNEYCQMIESSLKKALKLFEDTQKIVSKKWFFNNYNNWLDNILLDKMQHEVCTLTADLFKECMHSVIYSIRFTMALPNNDKAKERDDNNQSTDSLKRMKILKADYKYNVSKGLNSIHKQILIPENYIKKKCVLELNQVVESIKVRKVECNRKDVQINELSITTKPYENIKQKCFKCLIIFEVK